jgi:hypothetical protein
VAPDARWRLPPLMIKPLLGYWARQTSTAHHSATLQHCRDRTGMPYARFEQAARPEALDDPLTVEGVTGSLRPTDDDAATLNHMTGRAMGASTLRRLPATLHSLGGPVDADTPLSPPLAAT